MNNTPITRMTYWILFGLLLGAMVFLATIPIAAGHNFASKTVKGAMPSSEVNGPLVELIQNILDKDTSVYSIRVPIAQSQTYRE